MQGEKVEFLKGQQVTVEITGLGSSGEGVGRINGFTVFVEGALTGESAKVKLLTVKKNYAVGELLLIEKSSSERVEAPCPLFSKCGGCQLQHLSYEAQLTAKREQVQAALIRIGRLPVADVLPVLNGPSLYYRNKMLFPVGGTPGKAQIGCYARASHIVVDVLECIIQHPVNNQIMNTVRDWMNDCRIPPYSENTGSGVVRHIMGRVGARSGEAMAVLVTSKEQAPYMEKLVDRLKTTIPGIASIQSIVNTEEGNVALSGKSVLLYGKETISDSIGDFKFNISAKSFFQVNSAQTEVLYNTAVEMAGLTGVETVVEVYCGAGSISLFLAARAKKVLSIELSEDAVKDARMNAAFNKCDNVEFIAGDAALEMPKLAAAGTTADVVLLDPPRAGCSIKVLEAIDVLTPARIVYISCNPSSLARDVGILSDCGYRIDKIQPVDMFPMTSHVECVVSLERGKIAK